MTSTCVMKFTFLYPPMFLFMYEFVTFCSYWISPNAKSVETAWRPSWHCCITFKEVKDVLCKVSDLTSDHRNRHLCQIWRDGLEQILKSKTSVLILTFWPLTTKFASLTLREYFAPESEETEIPSWRYCCTHKYWMDSPAQRHKNCTETISYFSTTSRPALFLRCAEMWCILIQQSRPSPPEQLTWGPSRQWGGRLCRSRPGSRLRAASSDSRAGDRWPPCNSKQRQELQHLTGVLLACTNPSLYPCCIMIIRKQKKIFTAKNDPGLWKLKPLT